ncbi:MAG: heavy metal translocating P-type ATPase [Cloacibacterium sp.]|nr:heavy metal translocating P-type ATPase [Cloacibacterium sp.]
MCVNQPAEKGNKKIFGLSTELLFTILSLVFLLVGVLFESTIKTNHYASLVSFALSYFFGGYFAFVESVQDILKGKFEIDFLMIFAAVGSAILGKYSEGALLLFLFSLGHALEHFALDKAKKQIKALSNLTPPMATVRRDGQLIEIPVEELNVNEVVVVKTGTKIPVDGVVLEGFSSVNQAPITGESVPVEKSPISEKLKNEEQLLLNLIDEKHKVFAGTINGDNALEIRVLKIAADSTVSRLIKMVNEAESQQSPTQQFTKKIEKYYVPAILVFVILLCFSFLVTDETFGESFYRAMKVLVAGSPCALAISTPSAVLSGIARAAKERVLIKGGRALEALGSLTAVAFDKTGTLTAGVPTVKNIFNYNTSKEELIDILYSVERLSPHPLAKAITKKCEELIEGEHDVVAENISNVNGKGITAVFNNNKIFIGNRSLMDDAGFSLNEAENSQLENLHSLGHTTMIVATDKKGIIGIVSLLDDLRPASKSVISNLKKLGISKLMMLSGDNQKVADTIGKEIGITHIMGNLMPEDKLKIIKQFKQQGETIAMVGDGVNDAPAMATSDVGIAMGVAGSDVALETADVALLSDKIENLPFVIGLSRESKKIINQNLIISLGMIVFLIPASLFGLAEMGLAVLLHEGSTVVVVFNALRLLAYRNTLKEKIGVL